MSNLFLAKISMYLKPRVQTNDTAASAFLFQFGLTKMGAIFFPTSLVGVAMSSFPKKLTLCLTFMMPSARRTRTQNGQ